MLVTTPPGQAVAAGYRGPQAARRGPHLWQVDVVRLAAFSAVIAVHVLAFTEQPDNRAVAGAMMLLQFGREVFFALTGFVLVYSTLGRPFQVGPFWRKRMLYVAVPYVTWSAVYYSYAVLGPQHLQPSLSGFGLDLLYGSAMYHLYFLLVTLQLYLVFPLLMRFVRRTADRALPVLAGVTGANLIWMAVLAYAPTPSSGMASWMFHHSYELLPTYAMYMLAGCYAAVHLERVQDFVRRRQSLLLYASAASASLALASYALQLPFMAPRSADQVVQPAMVLAAVPAGLVAYVAGTRWAEGPRRHQRTIELLSDASFGIYLAHPLVLQFLLDYGGFANGGQRLPAALATVLGYAATALGATAISLVLRRTPLSLALAGRAWRAPVTRYAPQKVLATC